MGYLSSLNPKNAVSQASELIKASANGAVQETLGQMIPGYSGFTSFLNQMNNRSKGKRLGVKNDASTVDNGEYNSAVRNIKATLGGSYNPLKFALNTVRSLTGYSHAERVGDQIKVLTDYANLYDAYMFSNRATKFLKNQIFNRINSRQSWLGFAGLASDSKRMGNDQILQSLKESEKAWINSYATLLDGGDKGVGFTQADYKFLKSLRDEFFYHKHTKDLASEVDKVLQKADQAFRNNVTSGREAGQNLAKTT